MLFYAIIILITGPPPDSAHEKFNWLLDNHFNIIIPFIYSNKHCYVYFIYNSSAIYGPLNIKFIFSIPLIVTFIKLFIFVAI